MSHQICPPCRSAVDIAPWELELLGLDKVPPHDPAICRDQAIQPHGCACQHGQRNATEGSGTQHG